MSNIDFSDLPKAAQAFTPQLTEFIAHPLFSEVWSDPALSRRDRSLITIATLVARGHIDELPAHLKLGMENGVTKLEVSALITQLAFYAGFPAAVSASACANVILGPIEPAPNS
jgi:4-carboxymuconolactone decarboxylase